MRLKPRLESMLQHINGHCRLTPELARQRPFRPDTVGKDAAEDAAPRRCTGDLLNLGLAIDRVEANAERVGAGDITLFFDRVAVADAVGRGTGGEHHLNLR